MKRIILALIFAATALLVGSSVAPAGVVHASFNTSGADAKLLAILGPTIDDRDGYEMTEVADEEPWKSLR